MKIADEINRLLDEDALSIIIGKEPHLLEIWKNKMDRDIASSFPDNRPLEECVAEAKTKLKNYASSLISSIPNGVDRSALDAQVDQILKK